MSACQIHIRADLLALRDESYAVFQGKLMPTVSRETILGVRMPALRAYAGKIAGSEEAREFLSMLPHVWYDENNLHAVLLGSVRGFSEALEAVEAFLPYVDNWATCDMLAPKALLDEPTLLWGKILQWLSSAHTYTIRYGLVRMTAWYLGEPLFCDEVLKAAARVEHEDYYVRMAQAWFFSFALMKQYDATLPYLTNRSLPPWVHNKAIQKAVESFRVKPEIKEYLKTLRRRQGEK
ncbi:MAG: DNA alkylation repair protein [Clostridia bacterium]|nr:DNA alkylation repair protein [Clostridia bacterium]